MSIEHLKTLVVIPARYASTRFPGKPLVDIEGVSMIMRTYRQCLKASHVSDVVVATDDQRIYDHVHANGGKAVYTSESHVSGTDRCYEAAEKSGIKADIIINVQGDEPFIQPEQIDMLANAFVDQEVEIATMVKKIDDAAVLQNPNIPKVVRKVNGDALYFTRQCVPYIRATQSINEYLEHNAFYKHIGIYAFRLNVMAQLVKLSPSSLEKAEQLEQLRWLENGYTIRTIETIFETIGVDMPDDVSKAIAWLKQNG